MLMLLCLLISSVAVVARGEVAEPDVFPDGTDVSTAFPGVTLSVFGPGVDRGAYSPLVFSREGIPGTGTDDPDFTGASTGTRSFRHPNRDEMWFENQITLRADFDNPTDIVALDYMGRNPGADPAFLRAFDPNGALIAEEQTSAVGVGTNTLQIVTPTPQISHITASGFNDRDVALDNLRWGDSDGDGIVDGDDNCPDELNSTQDDADLDRIGDICDPFPNESDHDKAQCLLDLGQCIESATVDQDNDGEADDTDACPDTPPAEEVDDSGCSHAQFCDTFDPTTTLGRVFCRRADWKNDDPLRGRDCTIDRGTRVRGDETCVPR